jgi:large subunit ribosomal protein L25
MEEIVLALEHRDVTGKAVKRLRSQGFVPAVIHDHGKDSVIVMGQYVDVAKAYQHAGKNHPVSLKAGSKQYMALIKTVDFDPKKHLLRHVVFNAVKANEKVTAEVPVHVKYDEGNEASPAERNGFVVLNQLEVVEVEALPKDLPEALYFDGEKLVEVGDHVTVADLIVPKNVTVKAEETHPLATVFEPSALQAANDSAGGTDEEVTETEKPEGETVADAVEGGEENADNKPGTESKEEKKD